MNKEWFQMFVKAPDNTDSIALIKRCEPFLEQMTCIIETSLRTNHIIRPDGSIGIRGFNGNGFRYAKQYLIENGFTIEGERTYNE